MCSLRGVGNSLGLPGRLILLLCKLGSQFGVPLLQCLHGGILCVVGIGGSLHSGILLLQLCGQLVAQRFVALGCDAELRFASGIQSSVYFVESGSRFCSFLAGSFQIVPQLIPFGRSRAEALFHRIDFSRGFFGFGLQFFQVGLGLAVVKASVDNNGCHSFTSPEDPTAFLFQPYLRHFLPHGF